MMKVIGRIDGLKGISDGFMEGTEKKRRIISPFDLTDEEFRLIELWQKGRHWLVQNGYERRFESVVPFVPYLIWAEDDAGNYRIVGLDNEALYKENEAYRTQQREAWVKEFAYMPAVIGEVPNSYEAGEKIEKGDMVYIGVDGKAYPMPKHGQNPAEKLAELVKRKQES